MTRFLLFLLVCLSAAIATAQTSVLFIGNSYTYVNDLPTMFNALSTNLNKTVITGSKTNGGYTFQNQWNDPATYTAIHQQEWNVIVLQAQSQEPSFPTSDVNTNTLPFAIALSDSIYASSDCSNVMYYMTWGRENGDPQWDSINTFDKMNLRLYNAYMQFAETTSAMVSPVAAAWKNIRDNHPTIQLYSSDGSHPSMSGTYLVACTFYAAIFQETPVGATYFAGLDQATALILQQAAANTVIGSEDVYHLHDVSYRTVADFNWNLNEYGLLELHSTSTLAASYHWDFGDGTTSTEENPTHQYTQAGTYAVELIATSDCNSDTLTTQITVSTVGLNENTLSATELFPNPTSGKVTIKTANTGTLHIFDTQGKCVAEYELKTTESTLNLSYLTNGIYSIRFIDTEGKNNVSKLVIQQ